MSIQVPFMRASVAATAIALLAACTTTHTVGRPDGRTEYDIACGQAMDWSVCQNEARSRCPYGYDTLSQDIGFTAKELRVLCYPAPKTLASTGEPVISPDQLSVAPVTKPRKVFVTSEPHSLLLEDLARRMLADPAFTLTDDKASAEMILRVEAYNFDFSDNGSDSQHVSLGKYQIPNLVGAAFFMPEASSYNVDIQHFRAEAAFEFAYSLLSPSGALVTQKVIRDHIERESTQCSQPTVNNAFGGVVPAQFWASDDLQAQCSRPDERPSKSDMQDRAESKIGQQMRTQLIDLELPKPPVKAVKKQREKKAAS